MSTQITPPPPSIIKQILIAIEKRIRKISLSEQIFIDSAQFYNNALQRSGYKYKLKYQQKKKTIKKLAAEREEKYDLIHHTTKMFDQH